MGKQGELFVQVHAGRQLRDVEGFGGGKNDPYVKLTHFSSAGTTVVKTKHIDEAGADPVWHDAEFKFAIMEPAAEELLVEVYDYNIGRDVIIGSHRFQVNQAIKAGSDKPAWYPLTEGKGAKAIRSGEVQLSFIYRQDSSFTASASSRNLLNGSAPLPVTSAATASTPGHQPNGPPDFKRRREMCTVLTFFLAPWLCVALSIYCLRSTGYVFYAFLAYLVYIFTQQDYHRSGGLMMPLFRKLPWWRWFANYFPIKVHPPAEKLDTSKNYIFGVHPHGIISLGAFGAFATEGADFSIKFPGITPRVCTLAANFYIPFYGFYLAALGVADASKDGIIKTLSRGPGHSCVLVLGGAKESLDAKPGTAMLTLRERKGFAKIALETGAHLVPVFMFGESDVYDQVDNPVGSPLRERQNRLQEIFGFALPLVKGRGVFQYDMGLLPHRHPIDVVVGPPIPVTKPKPADLTPALVDELHAKYMAALQKLYDDNKGKYGYAAVPLQFK